eukprot:TRINITY_DN23364_c0_g1_i4.p1 TRINITY_DN23364_c0_g1~~TRINITY_DN23364_c0_g1_i4.p1  ORF type:complete len:177 (-),score=33.55 TRINITY_DN23364_c0_g1_i4:308-838(-)
MVVAGTFDRLHSGHRLLLSAAAMLVEREGGQLFLGITGDELIRNKKLASDIQPYQEREARVVEFVRSIRPDIQLMPGPITSSFGGVPGQSAVRAIAVSSETVSRAHLFNFLKKLIRPLRYVPGISEWVRAKLLKLGTSFEPMSVVSVPIITDPSSSDGKVSSSILRLKSVMRKKIS